MNPTARNLLLLITCLFAFIVNLGVFWPDLMEARNFVTAREILQNDRWLLPTMNGVLRLEKPPFPTWLSAATLFFFGEDLFWLRLPAALIACLLVFYLYRLAKTMFRSSDQALLAVIILCSSPTMLEMGRTGSWDIFCQAFIMGAIWYFYQGFRVPERRNRNFLLGALFVGLSSMSKGPVAIYGMLLPFLISYFIVYGFSAFSGRKKIVLASVFIAVTVALWWYVYARIEVPYMSSAVAEKEIDAWVNRHQRPPWFYLHFPVFTGIWSIFIIASFFYGHFRKKVSDVAQYRFLLFWVLIAVFLLSLVPEKKERYLLPVMPPMALLSAMILQCVIKAVRQKDSKNSWEKYLFVLFGGLLLLVLIALPVAAYTVLFQAGYLSLFSWLFILIAALSLFVFTLVSMRKKQLRKMTFAVAGTMAIITGAVLPALPEYFYQNPGFRDISEIREKTWYDEYAFYSPDMDLNLKAIWRIGKVVHVLDTDEAWPEKPFVLISYLPPQKALGIAYDMVEITELGTYDYYRKKSKFKLYVHLVQFQKE